MKNLKSINHNINNSVPIKLDEINDPVFEKDELILLDNNLVIVKKYSPNIIRENIYTITYESLHTKVIENEQKRRKEERDKLIELIKSNLINYGFFVYPIYKIDKDILNMFINSGFRCVTDSDNIKITI